MKALSESLTGKNLAIWGASHQGFTLAATTCLGEKAEYIIDSAPFKHGKYAPASHLVIVSPDEHGATATGFKMAPYGVNTGSGTCS